jgi:hypothetical protein
MTIAAQSRRQKPHDYDTASEKQQAFLLVSVAEDA